LFAAFRPLFAVEFPVKNSRLSKATIEEAGATTTRRRRDGNNHPHAPGTQQVNELDNCPNQHGAEAAVKDEKTRLTISQSF